MSVQEAVARVRRRLGHRVESRALRGQDIAVELHETAPRGGENTNRYGEQRSAPGEPPAIETGQLLASMRDGYEYDPSTMTASFVTNYAVLEYGYDKDGRRLEPRPMGRQTIDKLKQEVSGGS